ncbi:trypsin inhibitor like cysteine rich domain-containing protein [Ditylenchus destructor]|nr:trypsin inhibitor like cysteine rich domain-containing protein [Ditylenchus destructor]
MSSKVVFVVLMLSVLLQVGEAIVCPPNEQFDHCGKKCEPSCRDPNPVCTWEACVPEDFGCRCEKGFYRDDTSDTCVEGVKCIANK